MMNMYRYQQSLVLVLGVLCLTICGEGSGMNEELHTGWLAHAGTASQMSTHSPISINGDADLVSQALANGWAGNGTPEHPYIIENYTIDANGGTHCIYIKNTTLSFVLRNCTLANATDSGGLPPGSGVFLENVTNATLTGLNINYSYTGICTFNALNITCTNCTITNTEIGIYLCFCTQMNLTGNNISSADYGILEYSVDSSITYQNTITRCNYGIWIYRDFSQLNVSRNNITATQYTAIRLESAESVVLYQNYIENARLYGIEMYETDEITIHENSIFYASHGISMNMSTNTTITQNNISYNYAYGIQMYNNSSSNLVFGNVFYSNLVYAINLTDNASNNLIYHNSFYQNAVIRRGVSGNSQCYDDGSNNCWYNASSQHGNYWDNWDGNAWGTPDAYRIDGTAGAYDMYPLGTVYEGSTCAEILFACLIVIIAMVAGKLRTEDGTQIK
jgi:parallel beta-helix repeat protein